MKKEGVCIGSHLEQWSTSFCAKEPTSEKLPLSGMSIFLAEDEFINQRMISSFLKEKGASITLFENGLELLLALEESRPNVVLTDIQMPVMNGLQAVRRIRESERCFSKGRLPIIALTANDTQGNDAICFTAGVDKYFTKPLDMDSLTSTILSLNRNEEFTQVCFS